MAAPSDAAAASLPGPDFFTWAHRLTHVAEVRRVGNTLAVRVGMAGSFENPKRLLHAFVKQMLGPELSHLYSNELVQQFTEYLMADCPDLEEGRLYFNS
jgi:hypothetical protein